jgi:hypothetical protein
MKILIDRLKEPSTWLGLLSLGCVFSKELFGIDFTPEQSDAIMKAGLAFAGATGVFSQG